MCWLSGWRLSATLLSADTTAKAVRFPQARVLDERGRAETILISDSSSWPARTTRRADGGSRPLSVMNVDATSGAPGFHPPQKPAGQQVAAEAQLRKTRQSELAIDLEDRQSKKGTPPRPSEAGGVRRLRAGRDNPND